MNTNWQIAVLLLKFVGLLLEGKADAANFESSINLAGNQVLTLEIRATELGKRHKNE